MEFYCNIRANNDIGLPNSPIRPLIPIWYGIRLENMGIG